MNREDYDSPWKDVIERFFPQFMAFFFPRAYRQIDWDKGFGFLDKELQKATKQAPAGRRTVDKLVRVYLKGGGELWILIHIEVQGQREPAFAKRVFTCNYRLFDRHDRPIASLVILSDPHSNWRPQEYGYKVFDSEMKLRFQTVKLLDYSKQEARLRRSRNLFALVVLAHLKALQTRRSPNLRLQAKLELIRLLRAHKASRQDKRDLLRFIDWVLALPDEQEHQLNEILEQEEQEMKKYVTSWERFAKEKGKLEGELEGELRTLRTVIGETLEIRFGALPEAATKLLAQTNDPQALRSLHRQAVQCESLAAFLAQLPVAA